MPTTLPAEVLRLAELDRCAINLGIQVDEVSPGHAQVSVTVREEMLNPHGICHGGITFLLADTAVGYAANAEMSGVVTTSATINYTQAGRLGDRLVARASRLQQGGRSGVYDVEIVNQNGQTVAVWRGATLATASPVPDDAGSSASGPHRTTSDL